MNQHQIMSHLKLMSHSQLMNQPQMLNQSKLVTQPQMANQLSQPQMMSQMNQSLMVSQAQMVSQPPIMVNQSKMMSQSYRNWPQPPPDMPPMNALKFPNPSRKVYGTTKPGRRNRKGKKVRDTRKNIRRKYMAMAGGAGGAGIAGSGAVGAGCKPPTLHELERHNRLKARRFYPKEYNRMAPYTHAPRNTTSYIIRAKKSGGIASLVSPCPVTPAVLPTPVLSPSREALVDMAKEEWGVDGYGSMKGLIRLRSSPGHGADMDDYEEEEESGSSESDIEEHVEVERRLDHDLSRFEMIYPSSGADYNNGLENRVDDQDNHISQLEEENLILTERLYLMERELRDMKRRLQFLERQNKVVEEFNEEVMENVPENGSGGLRDAHLLVQKRDEEVDFAPREEEAGKLGAKEDNAPAGALAKEVYHVEALDKEGTTVDVEGGGKDVPLFIEGLVLDVEVDKKDETLENEKTGNLHGAECT
ncbi:hypothetical protein Nepgr_001926 [Nepenthes gracilis]|uniref:PRLI-interacting factor A n=1 Tax=Nepenthes gracilis TaxID=150966 RepID=A0AAD3P661_NEPGR|nr:hypothetical protein Nepgr_001926 [Nepenthes gracilis]